MPGQFPRISVSIAILWVSLIAFFCTGADLKGTVGEAPLQEEQPRRPRVLLIGDSISIGYTSPVQESLGDRVHVERIHDPELNHNAQHTGTGLDRLESWLGDEPWDVIHFNWGLWDLCYRNPSPESPLRKDKFRGSLTTSLVQYEIQLTALVKRLQETGAKLIWAHTTPVPEGESGRIVGDELRYNEVATRIMKRFDVPIDDLHRWVLPKIEEFRKRPGDVHFTEEGSRYLAIKVVASISTALGQIVESSNPKSEPSQSPTPEPSHTSATEPNIVVFMIDDMGWQDTSVPFHTEVTPFNLRYRTPNMKRLASRSMKFTQSYASAPVCTPTRTSLMTGMSPGQSHITFWTLNKDQDTSKSHANIAPPAWNMNGLKASDVTLASLLRNGGYRTIHVGKAHFGAHGTSGSDPTNLGFDVNVAGHGSGAPGSYYGTHHFAGEKREGGPQESSIWDVPGLDAYHDQDVYLTEALSMEAIRVIKESVASKQKFFLHFAPYAIHTPIMANKKYLDHYPDLDPKEAAYATMIESMDRALGDVLDCLETQGVRENTIILFTSDNGGLSAHARGGLPHTHNAPLNSGKGSAYEGGVRVPTLISWPGVTETPGSTSVPIVTHDLFPTILAMAGVPCPESHLPLIEGVDIGGLCRGDDSSVDPTRALYWNQPHVWGARGPGIWPFSSIRKGEWKLVYFHAGSRFELYNLNDDLEEACDLSHAHPELVMELAEVLTTWIDSRGVQLSIDKDSGKPVISPREAAARLQG